MTESDKIDLPVEHSCIVKLRGRTAGTLLCTPDQLEELALGWCLAQGVKITAASRVTVSRADSGSVADVDAAPPDSFIWHEYTAAGFDASYLVHNRSGRTITVDGIRPDRFEQQLQSVFSLFREHRGAGGYHHAAITGEHEIFVLATDISRHNAVDKVIGGAVRINVDPGQAAIMLSGRITADIALKGLQAGVPVIATRSLPTREAVELAEEAGLTLVCRALDHRRKVYGRRRIVE